MARMNYDEIDEREQDALREQAYRRYLGAGPKAMDDLDLRAAAQQAQIVRDSAAEREIDGELGVREARGKP